MVKKHEEPEDDRRHSRERRLLLVVSVLFVGAVTLGVLDAVFQVSPVHGADLSFIGLD